MATADRVEALVAPLLAEADLQLYDLELAGGVLRILVDRPGGADIDAIAKVARTISRALDEHDPVEGHYTLEVSSPGLERPLRTPAHFRAAVGESVKVKTHPHVEGDRRLDGVVAAADDERITVRTGDGAERTLAYDDIERARTTFEWGPAANERKKAKA